MGQGVSPAVARRRLRLALRRAREDRYLTQSQVAEALEWSLSKVQRIESGDVTISLTDVRALLALLDLHDPALINELVMTARLARQRTWTFELRYRAHLSPAMLKLLEFEAESSAIRVFHPTLVPGVLQTDAYAQVVHGFWREELTETAQEVRLEAQRRRREQVLDRLEPPDYHLVLDESVLHRLIGGPRVMAEQLGELLSLMERPNIHVRIVPFSEGAMLAMLNPFAIVDLADEEAILYREAQLADEIVEAPNDVSLYRGRFDVMWRSALDAAETERLIKVHATTLLAQMDTVER